jgi:hypothetical protein
LDDNQESTRNDTIETRMSHTLNIHIHGNPPIQLFGADDPPKPAVSIIVDVWPAGSPPEVPFRDDNTFRAASISASLPFWNDTIFPYLKLPRAEEDEIRDTLSGIDVTTTFTPYTGFIAGKLVVAAKEPPPIHIKNHKLSKEDADFLADDIAQLLACGAVRECDKADIQLIQPLGVVAQATKKRTIYDCRYLNRFCKAEDIKFDSLLSFAEQIDSDDVMFKSDLKSGYHHLALLPISYKYFGFEFRGKFYVWLCLPLGWNCSPRKFQLVTRALSAFTARHGLAKMIYLDDFAWAIRKRTPPRLRKWLVWQVFTDINSAGFHASKKKSLWDPATRMELLGMIVDSHELWFLVPEAKRQRYLSLLRELLAGDHARLHVQVALLEQVLGKLQSLSIAIPTISLFLLKAYKALAAARQHDRQFAHLPAGAADDLAELFRLADWKGLSRWPQWFAKRLKIFTDACDHSYGFSFLHDGLYQDFHGHFGVLHQQLRIHSKEHIAVQVAFEALPQTINDTLIDLYTDNEIVRWTVLKGGKVEDEGRTRAFALYLMHLQLERSLRVRVFRVPTEKNVRSDWLSRLKLLGLGRADSREAMLHPGLFHEVERHWGVHFTIDACANEHNRQTERFIATYDSDIMKPVAANMFAYHFHGEYAWIFPPFALIGPALIHLRSCKAKGVMVIPHDTTKQWWLAACEAATASLTLARRGEPALLDAATHYKTAHAPLKHDLIAIRFDFK